MSATPHVTGGRTDGTEAIGSIQCLGRRPGKRAPRPSHVIGPLVLTRRRR